MVSKKGSYEIFKASDDLWYFNRIAGNGEVEHPSEGYSTRGNAIAAIGRCMEDTSHYVIVDRQDNILRERKGPKIESYPQKDTMPDGASFSDYPESVAPDDENTGIKILSDVDYNSLDTRRKR